MKYIYCGANMYFKGSEQKFGAEVAPMEKDTYKKRIIEMVNKIDDISNLERIYAYVHKFFIRRTGE